MEERHEVTYGAVLVATAEEIIDVLHKHGIRKREVPKVFETVQQLLDKQPVMESKEYPNSR